MAKRRFNPGDVVFDTVDGKVYRVVGVTTQRWVDTQLFTNVRRRRQMTSYRMVLCRRDGTPRRGAAEFRLCCRTVDRSAHLFTGVAA